LLIFGSWLQNFGQTAKSLAAYQSFVGSAMSRLVPRYDGVLNDIPAEKGIVPGGIRVEACSFIPIQSL
jgi:hypothetical protein